MSLKMNPERVLHVVSAMNRGGTETLLMNVYRNIDRSRVQFDFVSHRNERCDYDEEIESLGGRIYRIGSLGQSGPVSYIRELKKIMSTNHYIAVHSHTDYQCGLPALAAKISGIPRRICHSHSNQWSKGGGFKEKLALKVLQTFIAYSATDYGACSVEAARFLFGDKKVAKGKIQLLKNGIEVGEYSQNGNDLFNLRKELQIPEDAIILGHVGNLSLIKNQSFILKVLKHLLDKGIKVVAVMAGDGPLRKQIEEESGRLGIHEHLRLLGVRSDISRLMNLFDVFIFPSLYEGFGIVTLEAQCAGTPCIVSDTVPKSTNMGLGLIKYISLDEDLQVWSKEIQKAVMTSLPDHQTIADQFSNHGFNIRENVSEWLSLYGVS